MTIGFVFLNIDRLGMVDFLTFHCSLAMCHHTIGLRGVLLLVEASSKLLASDFRSCSSFLLLSSCYLQECSTRLGMH